MAKRLAVIAGLAIIGAAGWVAVRKQSAEKLPPANPTIAAPAPTGIGCLGRIEPEQRALVTAPYYESRPSLVVELKVREGESVAAGQDLAVLDSRRLLESALQQADMRVALARQRINQARASAKPADIDALKAERARLQASLEYSQKELARYESLLPGGATSRASVDERALSVTTLEREIDATDQKIRSLAEVRPADLEVAESELAVAQADRRHIEVQMDSSIVKAPFAGRVITIHARQGEEVGPQGLLDLARTVKMYVTAEVFESDVARVRVGQKASARLPQSTQPLQGVVERIDQQVATPSILPADPLAFADRRVVKVFIRLDSPQAAESLLHGIVDVTIEP